MRHHAATATQQKRYPWRVDDGEVNEEVRRCENEGNVLTAVELGESVRGCEVPCCHGNATIKISEMYGRLRGLMGWCDEFNHYTATASRR